jgi:AbiJ N-terminal domain 4
LAIFDLFSKRKKRELGQMPDIFSYDKIPEALKVQIIHIWNDTIGLPVKCVPYSGVSEQIKNYHEILKILRREAGVFKFSNNTLDYNDPDYSYNELCEYFGSDKNIDLDLDIIELTFFCTDRIIREHGAGTNNSKESLADAAINELNQRFLEHGVGYSYSNGIIIRKDSEFIHSEAVKPALLVLKDNVYKTAESEFLSAHEHYRHGRNSEALMEACKAFESTMKIICAKRSWAFDATKPASHLINVCLNNGLVANLFHSNFSNLKGLLESGVPTPRNQQSGHGAGNNPPHSPSNELTAYVLHVTASTMLLLVESEKKLP